MGNWEEERDYKAIAASQTKAALGPKSTLAGDIIHYLTIIPSSTSPGAVTIYDGSSDTGTVVFAGGATSASDLKSFTLQLEIRSKNAGWLISTGAAVSVLAAGRFQ